MSLVLKIFGFFLLFVSKIESKKGVLGLKFKFVFKNVFMLFFMFCVLWLYKNSFLIMGLKGLFC